MDIAPHIETNIEKMFTINFEHVHNNGQAENLGSFHNRTSPFLYSINHKARR